MVSNTPGNKVLRKKNMSMLFKIFYPVCFYFFYQITPEKKSVQKLVNLSSLKESGGLKVSINKVVKFLFGKFGMKFFSFCYIFTSRMFNLLMSIIFLWLLRRLEYMESV